MSGQPDSPAVPPADPLLAPDADLAGPRPPPEPAFALVAEPAPPPPVALDAHGHGPADYKWVPVLRRPRSDGWSPQRQVDFIAALADTGCVAQAAREAGMSVTSCYRLRRESAQFAAAWDAALPHAARRLVDLAFDRAIHGSDDCRVSHAPHG